MAEVLATMLPAFSGNEITVPNAHDISAYVPRSHELHPQDKARERNRIAPLTRGKDQIHRCLDLICPLDVRTSTLASSRFLLFLYRVVRYALNRLQHHWK